MGKREHFQFDFVLLVIRFVCFGGYVDDGFLKRSCVTVKRFEKFSLNFLNSAVIRVNLRHP